MGDSMIVQNLPFPDYQSVNRMNPSTLKAARKSMLHLATTIMGGFRDATPEMEFGTAMHFMTLEYEKFEEHFVVVPEFHTSPENVDGKGKRSESKNTTWHRERIKEFSREHAGKKFLTDDQYHRGLKMLERLRHKPEVEWLLNKCQKEVTLYGTIEGVECKGRLDLYEPTVISDLKVTNDVSPRLFWNAVNRFGSCYSLAFYQELARLETGIVPDVSIIAIEPEGDHDCVVYDIPQQLLDNELKHIRAHLNQYKACLKSGMWPGVDGGKPRIPLYVPNWAMMDEQDIDADFDYEGVK